MRWRHAVLAVLIAFSPVCGAQPFFARQDELRRFNEQRHGALAWSGSAKAKADARQALEILSQASAEGLDPERYRVFREGDDPVANDASISLAVLTYMRDVAVGRPEFRAVDGDVGLPQRSPDLAGILQDALKRDRLAEMLRGLAPRHAGYLALKAALPHGDDRAAVIAANMERWRWLPADLEPDRIMINAASGQLEMWLGGKLVLTSRVIVGKRTSPTPILRAEGAGITINPPWTVPRSIAAREILPKLKRDHAWLVKHDMMLLDGPKDDPHGLHIDWGAIPAGHFPYQIRQFPGPRNPLGQIKLELPNRFDVYLHDTPDRGAFARADRRLSHGCVRVEQILPLASYALAADLTAQQRIVDAIERGETSYMPLQKKLPVYFLYWTAAPGADGALSYFPDIYGRDQRLIAAMRKTEARIAANMLPCTKG
ncbi:MAG TPA: L,D-transpeptidase family protein [Rhizomicrobium sp.]|jgi:murein L,D-transpeptidase YcbB/YkuD|nr:L,D-transpeptidase family protein [Rhizomicrobium sp.]